MGTTLSHAITVSLVLRGTGHPMSFQELREELRHAKHSQVPLSSYLQSKQTTDRLFSIIFLIVPLMSTLKTPTYLP